MIGMRGGEGIGIGIGGIMMMGMPGGRLNAGGRVREGKVEVGGGRGRGGMGGGIGRGRGRGGIITELLY